MVRNKDRKCIAKAIPREEAMSKYHLILIDMKLKGVMKV